MKKRITSTGINTTFISSPMNEAAVALPGFSNAARSWDELLTDQVDLLAEFELDYIKMLPEWRSAHRVVDIGCGNGAYLSKLAGQDPSKVYLGIDPSNELIAFAKARDANGISFRRGHAPFTETGQFDLILLRFVVQHISNPSAFFHDLLPMAHCGTSAIVIEPSFAGSTAQPSLPELTALIARYERTCRSEQRTRALVDDNAALAAFIGTGWCIEHTGRITARLDRATWSSEALRRVLHGWTSMLAPNSPAENVDCARQEIDDWIDGAGASIEIALNITKLQRRIMQ
ncbi:MAG: class I SAM-dependent methyltransferase [Alphaproteobacteria bacterium]|nr:class I SAM-dependent methyltransferase [Alphaproteobacteria bacterium]